MTVQPTFQSVVLRALGVLVLAAAVLKSYGLGFDPVAKTGIFSAASFQFLVITFEFVLAFWLLSGAWPIAAWLLALATFAGFAAVSFYQGWIGQASCGCFGSVEVNPWITFAVDSAAVAALLLGRPNLQSLLDAPRESVLRRARAVGGAVGGSLLLLGVLAAVAHYQFGSIRAALAALRNERLSLEPALIDMGEGIPGETREAAVTLTNRTDSPIRLIGGTADCSCTVLADLPVAIPSGESRSITIRMRLPRSAGTFTRRAELSVDDQGFRKVAFRVTGRIHDPP